MAQNAESKGDGKNTAQISGAGLAMLVSNIFDECLTNIIHETVVDVHRSEKILRMQSAATIAEKAAYAKAGIDTSAAATSAAKNAPAAPPAVKVETDGAIYDNGTISLIGNPLKTTLETVCPSCKLPRLPFPFAGAGAQKPDFSKQYCTRHPYITQPGHDCHGVPFPNMDGTKPKKEAKVNKRHGDKAGTPTSQDGGGGSDSPIGSNLHILSQLGSGSKGQNYIPWTGCPSCRRSMLIVRFAQHLDKCMGLSTRSRARTAANATGALGTTASNTPHGSRRNTPAPSGPAATNGNGTNGAGKDDGGKKGDAKEDETPKKKKKSNYIKKADRERMAQQASVAAAAATEKNGAGVNIKREREEDGGGDDEPRKKSKSDNGL